MINDISLGFTVSLPHWTKDRLAALPEFFYTVEKRMDLIFQFVRLNVEEDTGGPFAARVFESTTGT